VARTANPKDAAELLLAGALVGLPTETVYGLGAWADDPEAVGRLYAAKGRPADHPVIVHVAHAGAIAAWADPVPAFARTLAERFWPGPLTLVLPRTARARDDLTGGQDTVALRVPAHPKFQEVLSALAHLASDPSVGIAAPSANRFGRVSPTTAAHVWAAFDIPVVDGGACSVGVESTIVDCTGDQPRMLRAGAITAEQIEAATGLPATYDSPVRAPGTLASHYAPKASTVVITSDEPIPAPGERTGLLALEEVPTPPNMIRLAAPADAKEYAQQLYAALRSADDLECTNIVAVLPEPVGLGLAVRDRLLRAAAPTSAPSEAPHPNESFPH